MSIDTLLEAYPSLEIGTNNTPDEYDNPLMWHSEMMNDLIDLTGEYDSSESYEPIDESLDKLLSLY